MDKLLLGLLLALVILVCFAITAPLRPSDEPARPLTAAQLAARPLLLPPGAHDIAVTREIRTCGPDERRPRRSRFLWRITEFPMERPPDEIAAYYRQTLTAQGWRECPRGFSRDRVYHYFRRAGANCEDAPIEMVTISMEAPDWPPIRVEVAEMLPAPLEWPDPPSSP